MQVAKQYAFTPRVCRPYRARTKGNVAPLRGEHGSAAASTVFKIQPHLNAGAV